MNQPATFETRLGTIAVLDHGVAFIRSKNVSREMLDELGTGAKKKVGSAGAYMPKEKLQVLVAMENEKCGVLIAPTDLGDIMNMSADSIEQQQEIVTAIQRMMGHAGEKTEKEAGLFARSGMQIVWAIGIPVITAALYFLAIELGEETVDYEDIDGSRRGEKFALYWMSKLLGPIGTLIVGSALTLWVIQKAIKNSKNGYAINRYVFQ